MTDVDTGEITTFTIGSNGSLAAALPTTLVGHVPLLTAISPDGKFFYQGVRQVGQATIAGFAVRSNGGFPLFRAIRSPQDFGPACYYRSIRPLPVCGHSKLFPWCVHVGLWICH